MRSGLSCGCKRGIAEGKATNLQSALQGLIRLSGNQESRDDQHDRSWKGRVAYASQRMEKNVLDNSHDVLGINLSKRQQTMRGSEKLRLQWLVCGSGGDD